MSKNRRRKLTAQQKAEKKLIEATDTDEFIRQNADPIWLHQNEMWELIDMENSYAPKPLEMKSVELPAELLHVVSHVVTGDLAKETAKLLALELLREDKITVARAAALCDTPIETFVEFAFEHQVPLPYGGARWHDDVPF